MKKQSAVNFLGEQADLNLTNAALFPFLLAQSCKLKGSLHKVEREDHKVKYPKYVVIDLIFPKPLYPNYFDVRQGNHPNNNDQKSNDIFVAQLFDLSYNQCETGFIGQALELSSVWTFAYFTARHLQQSHLLQFDGQPPQNTILVNKANASFTITEAKEWSFLQKAYFTLDL